MPSSSPRALPEARRSSDARACSKSVATNMLNARVLSTCWMHACVSCTADTSPRSNAAEAVSSVWLHQSLTLREEAARHADLAT
ncbi:hypothetical protein PR003_g31837 [Phytophthora rubi]|uniref:Uncharacterized protein n=1 Tax=Phytophthora rubi TaxID=129364 RepID=A0A6A4B554_9STRA|nr:hypothetical protein PR003_g31837 [Phytophthora rubi]